MAKKIIITGATGFIGKKLVNALLKRGDHVIIFSRNIKKSTSIFPDKVDSVEWNYNESNNLLPYLEDSDAIVHLAGANLFSKRWNEKFKHQIIESRQISTRNLVSAIESCTNKPKAFISASAIGYYGDGGNNILLEESPSGKDFLAEVCKIWEAGSQVAETLGIRNVRIRTGIVLSPEDGALKQMLLPFKFFVGGALGDGKQWMSWLHIDDMIQIYLYAIDNTEVNGAINAVSPNPVTMNEFAQILGKVLKRPSIFKVPKFVLRIAVSEAANVITTSQRVSAKKLLNLGYTFKFPDLRQTFCDLLKK